MTKYSNIISRFAQALFCAAVLSACAGNQVTVNAESAQTMPLTESVSPNFYLVPGDEIEIKFFDRSDLNETTRVRPDGYIDLQLVGAVQAYKRKPEELSAVIAEAYRALGAGSAKAADVKYLLAVGDELEVRLPYHAGMDQTVRVRPDGRISLALAGTVLAQGMSPEALEEELNRRYAQHLRKPAVSVSVRNFSSTRVQAGGRSALASVADARPTVLLRNQVPRQIFIGGEVAKPGVLTHRHALTALQAVVEAGGLKSVSAGPNAAILRRTPDGLKLIPFDASVLNTTKVEIPNDIMLEPFDIIIVPKTRLAAAAEAVDQVFNLLPPLRNSSFGMIYQIDKGNSGNTTISVKP
jgi:polysaccharide export outer membrane protein